jgi:hypothetical protein
MFEGEEGSGRLASTPTRDLLHQRGGHLTFLGPLTARLEQGRYISVEEYDR